MSLILRNPHSVIAALETRPQDVLSVTIPSKASTDAWEKVAQLAKSQKIPVSSTAQKSPRPVRGGNPNAFQDESTRMGMAEACVRERTPISVEELFKKASTRADGKGLWLALDSLQDPHNVGAIFRAAAFFGVQGILLTQERSAPLTSVAFDVASGGLEYVPFSIQVNLQRSFEVAKEAGLWVLGTSEHAHDDISSIRPDRPWLMVLGNEERGMRRLTEEACDVLTRIAPAGKVTSLNVSVAAGILMSHLTSG